MVREVYWTVLDIGEIQRHTSLTAGSSVPATARLRDQMPARLGSIAPWSPVTAFGHPWEAALRLVPVAVAAFLFFAAGAIAEAPFEIAALAPPWTAALLGLCLAARSSVAPLFAACFAPLAVAALAPGSRWTAVQAVAIVAAFEIARGWARRFRAGEVRPTTAEFFGVALALHATLATRLLVPWESTLRQVLLLFGPPAIAALAAARISRRQPPTSDGTELGDPAQRSGGGTLVALVAVAAIGPGFTTPLLLTLVAFAAVTEFEAARSVETTPTLRRALALALLVLPCLFETRIGLLAAAAALAWVWPSWIARLALPAGLALAAIALRLREPAEVVTQLAWLPALVPGLWFVARRDRPLALTALFSASPDSSRYRISPRSSPPWRPPSSCSCSPQPRTTCDGGAHACRAPGRSAPSPSRRWSLDSHGWPPTRSKPCGAASICPPDPSAGIRGT